MTAANEDFEQASDDLPQGDQDWEYYYKGVNTDILVAAKKWAGLSKICVMRWIASRRHLPQ